MNTPTAVLALLLLSFGGAHVTGSTDGPAPQARCEAPITLDPDQGGLELRRELVNIYAGARVRRDLRGLCQALALPPAQVGRVGAVEVVLSDTFPGAVRTAVTGTRVTVTLGNAHLRRFLPPQGDPERFATEFEALVTEALAGAYLRGDGGNGADPGLLSGLARYAALKQGLVRAGSRPNRAGRWNDGAGTTGHFLLWLDAAYPGAVGRLRPGDQGGRRWTPEAFRRVTGQSVEALWAAYGRSADP